MVYGEGQLFYDSEIEQNLFQFNCVCFILLYLDLTFLRLLARIDSS